MMFGDICHGSVLLICGILLVIAHWIMVERQGMNVNDTPLGGGLFKIRYPLILLGFFAAFCGFIYNDFASIPLGYSTCYDGETQKEGCVHLLGIDPAWYLSEKELPFINSFKMKTAVIFGVSHMLLGVVIKGMNAAYFSRWAEFFFEFVPQLILMSSMFGYMDVLIVLKWLTDYTGIEGEAPSIIQLMIGMFLNGGALPEGTRPLFGEGKTQATVSFALVIVIIICVPIMLFVKPLCILKARQAKRARASGTGEHGRQLERAEKAKLSDGEDELPSPLRDSESHNLLPAINASLVEEDRGTGGSGAYKRKRESSLMKEEYDKEGHENDWRSKQQRLDDLNLSSHVAANTLRESLKLRPSALKQLLIHSAAVESGKPAEEEEHPFLEIMIHQLIETIEFVLNTISNTASYLRLWALSLAHSQLATVFFKNTLERALDLPGIGARFVAFWVGFMAFGTLTLAILMIMDTMECLLHTLRLHWVEFQSKFY